MHLTDSVENEEPTRDLGPLRRLRFVACAIIGGLALAACGSETVETSPAESTAPTGDSDAGAAGDEDEDHDDDDHDDEGFSGLGAHEHGSAELSVAWIDSDVVVDLISPIQNVFGFEYEPETDEDLAIAADRTEALTSADIITINDEAACELVEPAATEVEREGSHSEITVSWAFTCGNADEVSVVDLSGLFAEFPAFEDIDAEWISASSQSSAELSPESPTLSLKP